MTQFYKYEKDDEKTFISKDQIDKLTFEIQAEKLSLEIKEILTDKDFVKSLLVVARDLGSELTLANIKKYIDFLEPKPTKKIGNMLYMCGYSGYNITPKGPRSVKLIDVISSKNSIKLMFSPVNITPPTYLYSTLTSDDITAAAIAYTKDIGHTYSVNVVHEVLPNGEYHATIDPSSILEEKGFK